MKQRTVSLVAAAAAWLLCACASGPDAEPAPADAAPPMPSTEPDAAADASTPAPPVQRPEPDAAADAAREAEPTDGGSQAFANEGQCYFEGSGVYQDGAYAGTVSFVLLAEPFGDEELCRIQFDLDTVADADPECDFCYFSTVVQLSNPMEIANVDNACANSERALDPAAIEAMLAAPPVPMGFAEEASGHGEVLVQYDAALMRWAEVAFGSFDPDTGVLMYDNNEGFCRH